MVYFICILFVFFNKGEEGINFVLLSKTITMLKQIQHNGKK